MNRGDRVFAVGVTGFAMSIPVLLGGIVLLLALDAVPSITRYGLGFITSSTWNPVAEQFGAAASTFGAVVTSLVALLLAAPVGVGCAIFLAEYAPRWMRGSVGSVIGLLAAIPSIIYGLWGFLVLAPLMRRAIEPLLATTPRDVRVVGALFSVPVIEGDMLVAGVILAIMILPTLAAVSREVLLAVPETQRDGMLALGATRWETVQKAVLPYARSGIAGAAVLGLARALGETLAVALVIDDNSARIPAWLFTPGYTTPSAIASQFAEADTSLYFSALVEVALLLLIVAVIINMLARALVGSVARRPVGTPLRAG